MNENTYNNAKEQYAELGVDTDKAIAALKEVPISLHCWQIDDLGVCRADAPKISHELFLAVA